MLTFTTVKVQTRVLWGQKCNCNLWKLSYLICDLHIWYNLLNAILKILNELWIFCFGGGKVYFRHPYLIEIGYSQSPFFCNFWICWWKSFPEKFRPLLRLQGYEPASIFQHLFQCWTEGRRSTAVAEDFRPTATATVAEVSGNSYGRRKFLN